MAVAFPGLPLQDWKMREGEEKEKEEKEEQKRAKQKRDALPWNAFSL